MFGLKLNKSNFHPFEVVGRGTQLHMGKNLNWIFVKA